MRNGACTRLDRRLRGRSRVRRRCGCCVDMRRGSRGWTSDNLRKLCSGGSRFRQWFSFTCGCVIVLKAVETACRNAAAPELLLLAGYMS